MKPPRDPADLTDEELLAGRVGEIGATAGRLGSALGGATGGGRGGRYGARLAGRLLPTRQYEETWLADGAIAVTAERLSRSIETLGHVVDGTYDADGGHLRGVIAAGAANLNPAVVRATLTPRGTGLCTVVLSGAAKEGLVKQDTARKAVRRLAHAAQLRTA